MQHLTKRESPLALTRRLRAAFGLISRNSLVQSHRRRGIFVTAILPSEHAVANAHVPFWNRRQVLRGLGFGALGVGLPQLMAVQSPKSGRAKACIMLWL